MSLSTTQMGSASPLKPTPRCSNFFTIVKVCWSPFPASRPFCEVCLVHWNNRRTVSTWEMVQTIAAADCSVGAGFRYLCKSIFVSSCLDDSRPEPSYYGLRIPMISPILRLVARPELSRVKLTSRPTRLKKEVALAGKISPFG